MHSVYILPSDLTTHSFESEKHSILLFCVLLISRDVSGERTVIMLYCLAECKDDEFDCGNNGRCLNMSRVCNYFDDCANEDITDERNCSHPPGTSCVHLTVA